MRGLAVALAIGGCQSAIEPNEQRHELGCVAGMMTGAVIGAVIGKALAAAAVAFEGTSPTCS